MVLDDIEDIIGADDHPVQRVNHNQVGIKNFKNTDGKQDKQSYGNGANGVLLPGKGNVYVKTWGCAHNNSDGEYMAGMLASQGYTIIDSKDRADVWLLNSCTVKNPSQDVFINEVKEGRERKVPVIVAGCVPQGQPNNRDLDGLSMIGVQQIDRVVEVVEQALQGNSVQLMGHTKSAGAKLNLPKIRKNKLIEIIPINTGCLNQCTYCKTKHARGDLRSYPVDEIVDRCRQVVSEGIVEIWLTSEDTGTYGRDIGTSLPALLWKIVDVLPDGVMLRVGMTNPPYILEHLDEMVKILQQPCVYAFLHVPVQACSNRVLYDMKRQYTCEEFCRVVDALCGGVPLMTIATDVICGFPTETEEDFEETIEIFKQYQFPVVNISQFYPRQGTPAARMPRVKTAEVKRRSREMTKLFESYTTRDHYLGSIQSILVTEIAHDGVHYVGHTKSYDQVLVEMDPLLMGRKFDVRITETNKHFIRGEVIRESLLMAPVRPTVSVPMGTFAHDGSGHEFHKHLNEAAEEGEGEEDTGDCCGDVSNCGSVSDTKKPEGGGCCTTITQDGGCCSTSTTSASTTSSTSGVAKKTEGECCGTCGTSSTTTTSTPSTTPSTTSSTPHSAESANNSNRHQMAAIVLLVALSITLLLRIMQ